MRCLEGDMYSCLFTPLTLELLEKDLVVSVVSGSLSFIEILTSGGSTLPERAAILIVLWHAPVAQAHHRIKVELYPLTLQHPQIATAPKNGQAPAKTSRVRVNQVL